ncbi:MAG: hypothetical protein IJW29_06290 [Clostridia bacterium]|nr:hypothetical protein [Clostridia bacterium]
MTEKNMVKVTIEHDGETQVIEREAAFIVAYSDEGETIDLATLVIGNGKVGDMAMAIADSIIDQDRTANKGLRAAVSERMTLAALADILGILDKED